MILFPPRFPSQLLNAEMDVDEGETLIQLIGE